jgi:hypothetical protein
MLSSFSVLSFSFVIGMRLGARKENFVACMMFNCNIFSLSAAVPFSPAPHAQLERLVPPSSVAANAKRLVSSGSGRRGPLVRAVHHGA